MNNNINRRGFLKQLGMGTASAAALFSLGPLSSFAERKQTTTSRPHEGKMTYRINRHTGDKVSLLGYGMMRLPHKGRQIDQEMVNKEVAYALEHGVNYFDTSPHYEGGKSESSLGDALVASGVDRKSYYIATKMSNFGENEWSLEASKAMYKRSMEYMHTDYIDYYLLHGVGMGGMNNLKSRFLDNGVLDFLLEERKAGRIRNLGFSYHGDVKVFDYLIENTDKYKWDFVQIEMNYVDWKHAHDINGNNTNADYLYKQCEDHGIQCVMMEPLLGGRLAKLPKAYAERLKAKRPNDSIASWAFRFVGTQPNVLTALSGMTYMEHLEDNVKTYSPLDPCTNDELAMLEDIATIIANYPTIPCTACGYCMPCPYGVDIPGNFRIYNEGINEGTIDNKAAFVEAYKKALPTAALADQCVGCEECLSKCPQRIRIPRQMERLSKLLE